jgi:hypothetical protein
MMIRSFAALLLLTLLCTCGPSPKKETATDAPVAAPQQGVSYPSIELSRLEYLFDNATYMDATFYNLPVSINQSSLDQIRTTLGGIGVDPATIAPNCAPAGHIWFQVNGKNIEEADIYFQQGCVAYVWYENGKPAYSNQMTEAGAGFYQNIINSVKQQTGGGN